ncbi:hypothetical protein WJX73_004403 [Symbiochloris irregularis]|uniref:F-box domain-containing protein n=1 Tax=Symbiochloris irregularis TaxID=706552 RepID=A0AAW1PHF2_9CHLO
MQKPDWRELPCDVLSRIICCLASTERPTTRLVAKAWRDAFDADVLAVSPARLEAACMERWPALKVLNLGRVDTGQDADQLAEALPLILQHRTFDLLVLPSRLARFWSFTLTDGVLDQLLKSEAPGSFSVQHLVVGGECIYTNTLMSCIEGVTTLCVQDAHLSMFHYTIKDRCWPPNTALKCLVLQGCQDIKQETWAAIAHLRLKELHLLHLNGVGPKAIFSELASLTNLEHLVYCQHSDYAADTVEYSDYELLSQLHLTHVTLRGMPQLQEDGLAALSTLTDLHALDVSGSNITSRAFEDFSDLVSLRHLNIANTHITIPSSLAKILAQHSQLTHLDISQCR